MHTRRLHFLLPFVLPAAADAQLFAHIMEHSALSAMLARARMAERIAGEDFQRTLPHERWLARQFGVVDHSGDEAPLAPYMLLADGGAPGGAPWACVQPVHIHIASDHLLLINPESLALAKADATALLAIARPLIEELGVRLEAPRPDRWYLSSEQFTSLASAAPLRASGRNIEIWLPHATHTGERSRLWMKLQNEVQMAWFQHPVNEAREARGLPAINSIWFHAQGVLKPVTQPFTRVLANAPAARGLATAAQVLATSLPADFSALSAPASDTTLIELDALTTPFIEQDWASWQAAFEALERDWFAPALAALTRREYTQLDFTLCGDTTTVSFTVTRMDLRKFWRRRPIASLFEPAHASS